MPITTRRLPATLSRVVFLSMAAMAAVLFTIPKQLRAAVTFGQGNLVIYRVGTGTGNPINTGNPVFLDEYTTAGTLVQSVAMPTAASFPNTPLIASGTATSEGLLTRSVDGAYVLVPGYGTTTGGSASLAGTAGSSVPRVVGRVDAFGTIDTTTALTDWADANNPRGVASSDGSRLWVTGAAGGVRTTTLGSTTSTQLSTTVTNLRAVSVFGGQLFVSDSSGTAVRLGAVGAGLPTTSGQTITNLAGFPVSGSQYAFFFADLDAGVAGVDTLYVADDTNTAGVGGITKYTLVSGTWTAKGTVGTPSDSYRGLTGVVQGGVVSLYAIRQGGSGATGGGQLAGLTDANGYNGTLTGTPTLLATAAANTAFRGVALAPVAPVVTTPTVTLAVSTNSASETAQTVVTVTANTSAPVVGDQTVNVSVTGAGITAADYTLTNTTITIPNGTTSGSVTFTVVDDTVFEGTETATLTIGTASAGLVIGSPSSQAITITDNDPAPAACTVPHIAINLVQGTGETSPLAGSSVTVKGVVIGDFELGLGGFYLQDLPADYDADPTTSEGLFVFETGTNDRVSVGQVVQVTGVVSEFQGQTEITLASAANFESCGSTASVTPTVVTLPVPAPQGGVAYLERFEGMLVQFQQTLSVTEHFELERFGQIVMSSGGRLPQPTSIVLPGAQAQTQQTANDLNRIIVDDDLNNQDPDPILFGRGGNVLTALNTLRGGDTATNMIGVMTFGWAGNAASGNAYRLRPVQALGGGVPNFQVGNPRPSGPPSVGGSLKVVGMNVLNYFLTLDTGGTPCGPAGSKQACRGANNATELTRQQTKLNAALVKLNADVFGMMELENTDGVEPVADIVNRLNGSVGAGTYSYINTGVIGTDTIRVGIVYKPSKVTPVTPAAPSMANVALIGSALVDLDPVHNRPPVAQIFTDNGTGQRFTVIANHFKSKSCGSPSDPLDNDQGDGQGCWNATRVAQAQRLVSFIQGAVIPGAGDPDVILVGDFNAYAKEDPIRTIEQAGFSNLAFRYGGPSAYSYLFDGQWGYLDHALASTSLLPQITGAGDYHINSDEPAALDYNTEFKSPGQIASLFNADEFRISDHDPVMVGLALRASPVATSDHYSVEAGTSLVVGGTGVLGNDTGGPLALFSHTTTSHGTLTLNANGSFSYTPAAGFTGTDTFTYTVSSSSPAYAVQLFDTTLPPLATIGGVKITGGGYGSSLARVPGSTDEFYGLTDRGPNVDGPGGTKVEPIPSFAPAIGKFKLTGDQALLEGSPITLKGTDGVTPYSGRVNSLASTGETITDLNGNVLATDPNGYDPEGLVALPDGTFWVSDEYGPFITHFDALGKQIGRLSPFDGTLPLELAKRLPNRGMEGLTITPDGTTLVGLMQSALQQDDLLGFDDKKLTPLRIVTYRLADGAVHEYLYLLDNPNVTKTAASEITALTNTQFLVDERDGNFPPGAYKKLFLIDITGATDVGPAASVPGAVYNAASGGLLVGGKTIELLLKTPTLSNAESAAALAAAGITPAAKSLFLDLGGLLTSIDASGKFFGHDKVEGVAELNGGATLVIANDSDFGIDGVTNSTPPFQLHTKLTTAGVQDDGEFLMVDLVRSDATVTIDVTDTIPPDTLIDSGPSSPNSATSASFTFHGTDSGSGVASFECSLDAALFTACTSGVSYTGLGNGPHTFAVRAVDGVGNTDPTPASDPWTIQAPAPLVCDVNNDNVVNLADLNLIRAKNNQAASGPTDPFDPNHDGTINVADVRFCTLRMTPP